MSALSNVSGKVVRERLFLAFLDFTAPGILPKTKAGCLVFFVEVKTRKEVMHQKGGKRYQISHLRGEDEPAI